jgi:hypothetical protein
MEKEKDHTVRVYKPRVSQSLCLVLIATLHMNHISRVTTSGDTLAFIRGAAILSLIRHTIKSKTTTDLASCSL